MPATIDTALFQHAANYTGRQPKAIEPVYSAEQASLAIARLVKQPQAEVIVGQAAYMMVTQSTFAPEYEQTAARQIDQNHLEHKPDPATEGNLFEPIHSTSALVAAGGILARWYKFGGR